MSPWKTSGPNGMIGFNITSKEYSIDATL